MKRGILIMLVLLGLINMGWSKVDLVTLPGRDRVQVTIYNSADLTLVRESRGLTLKEGGNKLQFSWANTLIDPTSLELQALEQAGQIDISDLVFPPRVKNLGLWNIRSGVSGRVPVEITYFTSGLSWRAFYMGTLTPDEKTMRLQGYVRVTNHSGEDYENAQTRLIVGQVHLLDEIAKLARQPYPYGRPGEGVPRERLGEQRRFRGGRVLKDVEEAFTLDAASAYIPKQIEKKGLSEYFLYTIEGTETIPHGWSKRLPSFEADAVPVVNLYKYDEQMFRGAVVRFLSFSNDEDHKLGETPIPGGMLKVYRTADAAEHLSYEGQSNFKYIPVNEEVELNLGAVSNVVVEPMLMDYRTENYRFDNDRNVWGWDEIRSYRVKVKNTREVAVKVEVKCHLGTTYWDLAREGDFGEYTKVDVDSVKFTLVLKPRSLQEFNYTVRTYHGTRRDEWMPRD